MSNRSGCRLLDAVLSQKEGRGLVRKHKHFEPLLEALKGQAHQQGQLLLRRLTSPAAAALAAAPAAAAQDAGPSGRGGRRNQRGGKKAAAAAAAAALVLADANVDAVAEDAISSVGLYCKAALHMALTSVMAPGDTEEEDEEGPENAAHRALIMMLDHIKEAVDMVEQVCA